MSTNLPTSNSSGICGRKLSRRGVLLGGAASFLLAGSMTARAQASGATLFINVNVFDGVNLDIRKSMSVLVEGNMITAVESGTIKAPDGATVIDGAGRTLMPGLIDNHVHLFMSATSQMKMLDPVESYDRLEGYAKKETTNVLMRGFTAVRDMGGPVFGLKAAVDKGEIPGPRIYPSGALISQTSGHGDFRMPKDRAHRFGGEFTKGELLGVGFVADGRDEVLTATRENLRGGASQIKVMAGGGAATAYDPLDTTQYTLDELKAAVEAADDWNTYVTVHAYTPKSVRRAIEAGVKCIEHGQLLDEETMMLVAEKGIWLSLQSLDPAPATAPENIQMKKKAVVEGTDAAFKWAKKHKVKLAFGTDLMFDARQMGKMNTDIMKLKQWFTPGEALRLVTGQNAELLALSGMRNPYPGKLGVIENGAYADMLLVDGDPVANLDLVGDPDKNFKIIMKDGKIYKNTL